MKKNLLSEKGIEMRGKRAEYSERVFGQIKWNMGFKRFLLRGLKKVSIEWGLLCIAVDIMKMHKKELKNKKEMSHPKDKFRKNLNYFMKSKTLAIFQLEFLI